MSKAAQHGRRVAALASAAVAASLLLPTQAAHAVTPGTEAALQFNGSNQYVTFGNPSSLALATFTLEVWFKRTGAGVGSTTGAGGIASAVPLLTKGAAEVETPANLNMNWYLGIDASTGVLVADFEDTINGGNHPVTGTTSVPMNTWTHAAATYDGQTWKLYLNGNLDRTLTLSSAFTPETTSIQPAALATSLQSNGTTTRGLFQGVLDEAQVWNVARTQADIDASMSSELTSGTGLVARWGLNEGQGSTVSDSVGSATGTLVNGPTWVDGFNYTAPPPPPSGGAYSVLFNGTNTAVRVPASSTLDTPTFTVEAWINRSSGGSTTNTGAGGLYAYPVVTKGRAESENAAADINYFLGLTSSGKIAADFEEAQSGPSPSLNHPVTGNTAIPLGQWHHIAATYDGSTWQLYLDGQPDGSLAVNRPANAANIVPVGIGTAYTTTGVASGAFAGSIDEVQIWNMARSAAQIAASYTQEISVPTTGLAARWGMNEGTGTSVGDSSGNGNTGTLLNGSWGPGFTPSSAPPPPPASSTLTRYPYLTDTVGQAATVNWATTSSAAAALQWGPAGICTAYTVAATSTPISVGGVSEWQWKAKITGLTAGTQYCYRVTQDTTDLLGSDPSPVFTAAKAAGSGAFSFAVVGDMGQASGGVNPDQANVLARIAASGSQFVMGTGDITYGSPDGSQTLYGDLLNSGGNSEVFGPGFWGVPGRSLPYYGVLGNHGYTSDFMTNFPQDTAVAGSAGSYGLDASGNLNAWYAFDYGGARFYVLQAASSDGNYATDYNAHWKSTSAEYQWLKADLAAHTGTALKFAFWHYPLYSDGNGGSNTYLQGSASLQGLLNQYGVPFAFNGHSHIYQRNKPDAGGLVAYVTGGGGAETYPVSGCGAYDAYAIGWGSSGSACGAAPRPTSVSQVHHFLKVTVNGSQVTVTPTDEHGNTFDIQTYTVGSTPPPSNQPPVISAVTISPGSPVTTSLLSAAVSATDPDGDSISYTYQWQRNTGTGFANLTGATGATLDLSVAGNGGRGDQLRVIVTASDGTSASAPFTSGSVTVANSPPVAVPDTATTAANTPVTVAVAANDTDADGDPLSVTAVTLQTAGAGTASLVTSGADAGKVLYTPAAGFSGTAQISYTISDGTASATGTLTVTVGSAPPPSGPCPTGQWYAQYFNNRTLSGSPSGTRCETAINNNWGKGGPTGVGVGVDNFSVRWTQAMTLAGGSYTFTTVADDGIRVSVDGTWVINNWKDHSATTNTATVSLAPGSHTIVVEYYEHTGRAVAQFTLTGP